MADSLFPQKVLRGRTESGFVFQKRIIFKLGRLVKFNLEIIVLKAELSSEMHCGIEDADGSGTP